MHNLKWEKGTFGNAKSPKESLKIGEYDVSVIQQKKSVIITGSDHRWILFREELPVNTTLEAAKGKVLILIREQFQKTVNKYNGYLDEVNVAFSELGCQED